ncbi:MAG: hypothetical protein ACR2QJ_14435 [Geminicoccaceae bacterium]
MTSHSSRRSNSIIEKPEWIEAVRQRAAERYFSDGFCIEGLEITLNAVDPSFVRWVFKYLQPLSLGSPGPKKEACRFYCLYSDELASEAAAYFMVEDNIDFLGRLKNGSVLKCAQFGDDLAVYCNGPEGVVWLADFDTQSIFMIFSSRTRRPALEFSRSVREVVASYLTDQGWALFHAGAVETSEGALMIVGDPGAGKTSLLLALLSGGARYIANELLFVRLEEERVRVLGYPLVVAVGLGTAMHLPGLRPLIEEPDPLLYPRRRFDAERVARTKPDDWPSLDDKLQLLPEELGSYVETPGFVPGGELRAIVVPELSKQATGPKVAQLAPDAAYDVLADNMLEPMNVGSSKTWSRMVVRGLPQNDEEQCLERLANMNAVKLSFDLSSSVDHAVYLDVLLAGLSERTRL